MMSDIAYMRMAMDAAARVRCICSPNPWVGCVIVSGEQIFTGATYEETADHAEVHALRAAGDAARGATAYVTLEPCSHHGRTPPCADALIAAGVERVVVGIPDPDPRVSGEGIARLREAGIVVDVGVCEDDVREQLAPYIHQRTTGRPYVILKMAISIDGAIARSSHETTILTGEETRLDVHRLRAESDAILVGANTVRIDNPLLTVRDYIPPVVKEGRDINPRRLVLGSVSPVAHVQPCRSLSGPLGTILDELGEEEILQLMIEGGAATARAFHEQGLIDRYIFYIAPVVLGGSALHVLDNGDGPFVDMWRGEIVAVRQVGSDTRIDLIPEKK